MYIVSKETLAFYCYNPCVKQIQTTWNLKPLFESDDDPQLEKELKIVEMKTEDFVNKWRGRTDYLEDPSILKLALEEYENWIKYTGTSGKQGYYFGLRSAQDQLNPKIKAKSNKLQDVSVRLANEIQFFELSLANISKENQEKFLKDPLLSDYRHYLERNFSFAMHLLSDKEEKILNLKAKTSYENWVRMVSELISKEEREVSDEDGVKKVKNFSEMLTLVSSSKIEVRKKSAEALEEIFQNNLEVAEREINTVCEDAKITDLLRKYQRPDQFRHLSDDIDSKVVDQLLEVVSAGFYLSQEYYRFKADLMGLKDLKYYEKAAEYGKITGDFNFEKTFQLVSEVFSGLDKEFSDILGEFAQKGQLDVYPQKGKVSGAFCTGSSSILPVYVLLNHTNKLYDVLTLAHEMGHAINYTLVRSKENELNLGVSTAVAEVASTFMEDFVLQKLLEQADEEEKLALMVRKLDSDIATIFRQVAFYNFELELHENIRDKGYLTKEEIGQLFEKHMISYLGETGKNSHNWWIYVSHFRSFFYVYSYASGLLISKYFQSQVKKDPAFILKVKKMLSTGESKSPQELFAELGVDISKKAFWQEGLKEIEEYFLSTKQLAQKLGKI